MIGISRTARRVIGIRTLLPPVAAIFSPVSCRHAVYDCRSTGVSAADAATCVAADGRSNPVAMTVIFTLPSIFESTTAPKMMFASSCAASWMIADASLTSISERSGPPVTLMITPRAPFTDASSRSGLDTAALAAVIARPSPSANPVPMIASPIPDMIVLTSAKSRLISQGTRIRSEMPWIA